MKCPHDTRGTGKRAACPFLETHSMEHAPGHVARCSHHSIAVAPKPQVCAHHQGAVQAHACWVPPPDSDFRGLAFRTYYHRKVTLANGHGHNLTTTILVQSFSQRLSWKMLLEEGCRVQSVWQTKAHMLSLGKLQQTLQILVLQCQMLIFLHSLSFRTHFITDSMQQTHRQHYETPAT